MNESEQALDKIARIGETIEEACKVIVSSLNFLMQHYRVKQLLQGEKHVPRSLNHLQEKLAFLLEIGYLDKDQFIKIRLFFARYEDLKLAVSAQSPTSDFSKVNFDDEDEEINTLDQALTIYFRDYTELALLLVRLKVNSF